eukprot:scaffold12372_cov105-Skeletonema_marinoi.AAC.1
MEYWDHRILGKWIHSKRNVADCNLTRPREHQKIDHTHHMRDLRASSSNDEHTRVTLADFPQMFVLSRHGG